MIESILNGNTKKAVLSPNRMGNSPSRTGSVKPSNALVNNLMSENNSASTSFKNLPFLAGRKESKDAKTIQVKSIPNGKLNSNAASLTQ